MKKKIIKVVDNDEGWLNAFNKWSGLSLKMGDVVKADVIDLDNLADIFNNEVANGPAIQFEDYTKQ